jgi:hypothetical protein
VASIARGRHWLDEIVTGIATDVEQIAAREKCSVRKVNMTISLAFLAPNLVKAALDRSPAARAWSGPPLRLPSRVVASVLDIRPSKPLAPVSFTRSTKKKAPLESGTVAGCLFRRRDLFDWRSFGFGLFAMFIGRVQEPIDQAGAAFLHDLRVLGLLLVIEDFVISRVAHGILHLRNASTVKQLRNTVYGSELTIASKFLSKVFHANGCPVTVAGRFLSTKRPRLYLFNRLLEKSWRNSEADGPRSMQVLDSIGAP